MQLFSSRNNPSIEPLGKLLDHLGELRTNPRRRFCSPACRVQAMRARDRALRDLDQDAPTDLSKEDAAHA